MRAPPPRAAGPATAPDRPEQVGRMRRDGGGGRSLSLRPARALVPRAGDVRSISERVQRTRDVSGIQAASGANADEAGSSPFHGWRSSAPDRTEQAERMQDSGEGGTSASLCPAHDQRSLSKRVQRVRDDDSRADSSSNTDEAGASLGRSSTSEASVSALL